MELKKEEKKNDEGILITVSRDKICDSVISVTVTVVEMAVARPLSLK